MTTRIEDLFFLLWIGGLAGGLGLVWWMLASMGRGLGIAAGSLASWRRKWPR